jgi:cytochrome c-type biogenesis protein CcmF
MLFGLLGIWIGGLAILLSLFFYTRAMLIDLRSGETKGEKGVKPNPKSKIQNPKSDRLTQLGRRAYYVAMAGAGVAMVTLWVMLLGRHYEVEYVWKVTNEALPLQFRIAALWAEQEGTFLLWLIYGFILSAILLRRIGKTERYVMPFIVAVQAFLFVMLTVMTPFHLFPQRPETEHLAAWPALMEMLGLGPLTVVPKDGQGLNILLQNVWMTIHPPIMFMGFAATLIPCALALGALVRRDWDGWVRQAQPWVVYAFMFLGFGKFLGGYWAYETLGWGGYWAWDPVENASFVPWLISAAMVHGLQVQAARGSWKQVNLFLAITAFLTFFYGTFLTRSGALNEFSVHSFVSPGGLVMALLLGFLVLFAVAFYGLWIARYSQIRSEPTYENVNERPFGFFLGIILFMGAAAIVLIGMSWPILSRTFGGKAASINYQFYNRALLPVGGFVALLMAVTPLLSWRRRAGAAWKPKPLLKFALAGAALILAGCPVGLYFAWRGNNAPALFVFTVAVALALITNMVMLVRRARFGLLQTGGWLMHVGFCLCLIGVISTSVYSVDTRLVFEKGETKRLYGYDLTYTGWEPQPNGRHVLAIKVERGDRVMTARPRSFSHNGQTFNTPYILKFWDKDLYIAPVVHDDGSRAAELKKGQAGDLEGQVVTFDRFVTSGGASGPDGSIDIGVALTVHDGQKAHPVQPHMVVYRSGEMVGQPVELPGGAYAVRVAKVTPNMEHPEESTVLLQFIPKQPVDAAAFEVSTKPYVNVLWLGGYTMFLGGIIAWRRRRTVAANISERERQPEPALEGSIRPKRRAGLRPEPATIKMAERIREG